MSIDVMNAVQRLNLHGTAKAVLLKLADHCNDDGSNTFVGVDTIRKASALSRHTVQRQIQLLIEDGVLVLMGEAKDQRAVDGDGRCGKGRTRCYCINVEIARRLYGHWTGKGWKTFVVPGWLDAPADGAKGATMAPFRPGLKGAKNAPKGAKTDIKGCHSLAPKPSGTLENQAPACAAAPGAAPACAGEDGGKPPPACAVWKANWPAIEERLGREVCKAWLGLVIPDMDDGETLTLAVPSRFIADHILSEHGAALGELLGRRIVVVRRGWVSPALNARAEAVGADELALTGQGRGA